MDDLITESEAARILGVSPGALTQRRLRSTAPSWTRCACGHSILYRREDIERDKAERKPKQVPA